MVKIIVIGVTALVLFVASAGVSWYLQGLKNPQGQEAAEAGTAKSVREPAAKGNVPPPSHGSAPTAPATASRAHPDEDSERTVRESFKLRDQEEMLKKREQLMVNRRKQLELIRQDIKSEQAVIDDLRRQVATEVKALSDKVASVEKKSGELEGKHQETTQRLQEMKKTITEIDITESDRLKQMATMYDSMAPESAARILQQMNDTGHEDTAVKILSSMKERQAAKVLAEMSDAGMAAKLLEKIKGVKKPTAAAK